MSWFPRLIAVHCQPEFCFYLWYGHDPFVYSVGHYITLSLSFLMCNKDVNVPSSKIILILQIRINCDNIWAVYIFNIKILVHKNRLLYGGAVSIYHISSLYT